MTDKPATSDEAEELAKRAVEQYLAKCRIAAGPDEATQIGNYLMKLCSVAGVLMANAEGSHTAFDRLLGTAQFVVNTMPVAPAKIVRIQ